MFCKSTGFFKFILLLIIFSGIISLMIELTLSIIHYFDLNLGFQILYSHVDNNTISLTLDNGSNQPQDPVRWWPSGTPQSWNIIGAAAAAYRMTPGSPRVKGVAALATLGVTIPSLVYVVAVENPNGFNQLMFSWITYKQTGVWPLLNQNNISITEQTVNDKITEIPELQQEVQQEIAMGVARATSTNSNNFLPSDSDNLMDFYYQINLYNMF